MAADLSTRAADVQSTNAYVPRLFRVVAVRRDTHDTVTMELTSLDGEGLEFSPGQFTMLQGFGIGEVPISISGDPARPDRLVHTIRDVGGITQALCRVEPGDVLGVRGPYGVGWGASDGRGGDVVIVTGGIGLAPLRPAILEVMAARESFGRVSVLYGARTPDDVLFGDELESLALDGDIDLGVTVDQAPTSWRGRVGLVTELIPPATFDPSRTLALVCGPEVMMRHVATALTDRGVPAGQIRLSMERNMRCAIGLCGHCQLREYFICVDGPVFALDALQPLLGIREL